MKEAQTMLLALVVGAITAALSWFYIMGLALALRELPEVIAAILFIPGAVLWLGGAAYLWYRLFFGLARMLNVRL